MATPTPTTEQLRGAWESVADGYDRLVTPHTLPWGEQLVERLGVAEGDRVLDIGTGSGAVALPAARRGAHVAAVDVSPTMLDGLGQRAKDEGLEERIAGHLMDARELEFDDDTFDAALSRDGVTMFPDYARGFAEMRRVTRPSGRIAVASTCPDETEFIAWAFAALRTAAPEFELPMDPPPPPWVLADPEVFARALDDAGLKDVTVVPAEFPMEFTSAAHLWESFSNGNPLAAGFGAETATAAQEILDARLRERSGGEPGATLTATMNIGVATA